MAIDAKGNSHKAAGRPDGGQFDHKAGQGSDDDLAPIGPADCVRGARMPRPASVGEMDRTMEAVAAELKSQARDDIASGQPMYMLDDDEIPAAAVEAMGERNLARFGAWYYGGGQELIDAWDDFAAVSEMFADGVEDGDGFYYTEHE